MPNHYRQGVFYLLLGEFLFVAMAAAIKAVDDAVPHALVIFWRNAFGLMFLTPFLLAGGWNLRQRLKTPCLKYHLLRAGSGLTAMYGYFYIIRHIPLAEATLVKMSAPFFLPLVAFVWLKDKLPKMTMISILIGFAGVVIILKPGTDEFSPIALWGLAAALLASIAKVTIRKMGGTEDTVRIVFYFAVFSTLLSLIPAALNWTPLSIETWGWLVLTGLLGTLGQMTMTQAYRIAPPGKIGLFTYSTVIYASLFGWLFWGEVLSIYTLLGSALVFFAGALSFYSKRSRITEESVSGKQRPEA